MPSLWLRCWWIARLQSRAEPPDTTRSDPLQTDLIRTCLCGRGACAGFTLQLAALVKTNPTEWPPAQAREGRLKKSLLAFVRSTLGSHVEVCAAHSRNTCPERGSKPVQWRPKT